LTHTVDRLVVVDHPAVCTA